MISNRLGWMIMEIPSLAIFCYLYILGTAPKSLTTWVFFSLWVIHYFNRSVVFPYRTHTTGKKMPVLIMSFAIFFNFINAYFNGYWFGFLTPGYEVSWLYDLRFIIGFIIFITGFIINQASDQKLLDLRKGGKTGYFIPRGGLFNFISCPNFFGEIIEWAGFALMSWNLASLSFAIWTMVNLIPRARAHHKWYLKEFKDYPKKRKAVIPYII